MFNRNDKHGFTRLLKEFIRTVVSWWRIDRIRTSPRDGQLLRLSPGTIVSVRSRLAEVVGRSVCQTGDGPSVVYQCRTVGGAAMLSVRPMGDGRYASLQWSENGATDLIDEESVEVYARHDTGR